MSRPKQVSDARNRAYELLKKPQGEQGNAEADEAPKLSEYLDDGEQSDPSGQGQNGSPDAGTNGKAEDGGQGEQRPAPSDDDSNREAGEHDQEPEDYERAYKKLKAEHDRLEHQHSVLQGKYRAEVPRLQRQLQDAQAEMTSLKGQQRNEGKPTGDNRETGQANTGDVAAIKGKLLEEFPEDIVESMTSYIHAEISKLGGGSNADQISQMNKRLDQIQGQTFDQQMDTLVPDWKQIDLDPAFRDKFLYEVIDGTGRMRGDFYMEAYKAGDAATCASHLKAFKQRRDGSRTPDEPDPEPVNSRAEPQRNPRQPRVFKRSEIRRVENAARRGEYRGQEQKLKELRRKFREASVAGRIIDDVGDEATA